MADGSDIGAMASVLMPLFKEAVAQEENIKHLKGLKGTCELVLLQKGKKVGTWHIVLKGDKEAPIVAEGKAAGKPTLTLTIEDEVLLKLAVGKINPMTSFMSGKIKLSGNIMMAQKMEQTFRSAGGYEKSRPFVMEFINSNQYLKSKL